MTNYDKKIQEMTIEKFSYLLALSTWECYDCPLKLTCNINRGSMTGIRDCAHFIKKWLESEEKKNDPAE